MDLDECQILHRIFSRRVLVEYAPQPPLAPFPPADDSSQGAYFDTTPLTIASWPADAASCLRRLSFIQDLPPNHGVAVKETPAFGLVELADELERISPTPQLRRNARTEGKMDFAQPIVRYLAPFFDDFANSRSRAGLLQARLLYDPLPLPCRLAPHAPRPPPPAPQPPPSPNDPPNAPRNPLPLPNLSRPLNLAPPHRRSSPPPPPTAPNPRAPDPRPLYRAHRPSRSRRPSGSHAPLAREVLWRDRSFSS